MITIILGLHIALAISTFASGAYLLSVRFTRRPVQGYLMFWGGLNVSTIVSGALLTVLAGANVMSACANIGLYAIALTLIHVAVFGVGRTILITPSVALLSCLLLIL